MSLALRAIGSAVLCLGVLGCGTTRSSDTSRTATEQLLISDAVDRAVSRFDFRALAGRTVYLDDQYVKNTVDSSYLVSSVRQQMLASGCIVMDKEEEAEYVVEIRAGAVGTDRNDLLFGVPATQLPASGLVPGVPSSIPEIPLVKRTAQRGVSKLAIFAYNRNTGRPVWQSGVVSEESKAKDVWVFGAGPFQRGSIHDGTKFAGSELDVPLIQPGSRRSKEHLSVADEAFFVEPTEELAQRNQRRPLAQASAERERPQGKPPAEQGELLDLEYAPGLHRPPGPASPRGPPSDRGHLGRPGLGGRHPSDAL